MKDESIRLKIAFNEDRNLRMFTKESVSGRREELLGFYAQGLSQVSIKQSLLVLVTLVKFSIHGIVLKELDMAKMTTYAHAC